MSAQFDFAPSRRWLNSGVEIVLCVLALLLVGMFYWLYQTQARQLATLEVQQMRELPKKNIRQNQVEFSNRLGETKKIQHDLTLPWLETLAQLEQIKQRHPSVHFVSVEPNASRAQVYLKVKAKEFSAVSQFLDALKTVTLFGNAELTNQFAEDEHFSIYEVKVDWKI